jgi:hypothetical protein
MTTRLTGALLALTLAFALPLTAGAQTLLDRIQGLYYPQGMAGAWNCRDLGSDGGAVGFVGDQIRGVESACQLKEPFPIPGMDAVRFTTTCSGEGETWEAGPVIIVPHFDGVTLVYQDFANTWLRCPG